MVIRNVTLEDVDSLLGIYSYYVENTAISFEFVTPTKEEFSNRIINITKKYPYLVAVEDEVLVGYAYATSLKQRQAYDHCVETTVYVDKDHKHKGIGKALYEHLERQLSSIGITNLYACVAVCDEEDEYLTNNSWRFHEHMGYKLAGRFHSCGHKFGNNYDIAWLEKIIEED